MIQTLLSNRVFAQVMLLSVELIVTGQGASSAGYGGVRRQDGATDLLCRIQSNFVTVGQFSHLEIVMKSFELLTNAVFEVKFSSLCV